MMNRRTRTAGPTGTRDRRTTLLRLSTILALLLMAAAALIPQAVTAENPFTTLSPRSDHAGDIQGIYKWIFWLALIVFVGVQAGIAYTVLRYRRRSDDDERPEQIHGNKTLEIAWTILPAIVLLAIFIPTVQTMYDHDAAAKDGDVVIEVYGKQWWWEVHYTEPQAVAGVITANEIHVPQGKKILVKLYTNNVIHSFWVGQLAGKMDLIPGHENRIAFTPDRPGYYWGQCAEFCGDSHTNMQFKVIVEPEDQFNAWVAGWKAGPSQLSAQVAGTGDVTKAPPVIGKCAQCHNINGTQFNQSPVGIDEAAETDTGAMGPAKFAGPNLTLFGCRTTFAGSIFENTPENLAKWLHDPSSLKPGNYMGQVIKPGSLSDQEITEIIGYLESLKPEGGCPTKITGEVLPDTVASPAANQTAVAEALVAAQNAQATAAAQAAEASATAAANATAASATAAAQPTPAPQQGGQQGGTQPAGPVEVDMVDINFTPKEITIPAGTDVTINLVNKGAATHNFNIDALNVHSGDYPSGQTGTVTINAAAGDYEYYCNIPGHKEQGMVGVVHVVAGAAPPADAGAAPPPDQGAAQGGQPPAEVDMVDINFNPKEITIAANTDVAVNLKNSGAATHNFNIDALNIHSGDLGGGQTGSVTINAAPGEYEYYCNIPGHKEQGMVGKLIVQ